MRYSGRATTTHQSSVIITKVSQTRIKSSKWPGTHQGVIDLRAVETPSNMVPIKWPTRHRARGKVSSTNTLPHGSVAHYTPPPLLPLPRLEMRQFKRSQLQAVLGAWNRRQQQNLTPKITNVLFYFFNENKFL